MSKRGAGVLGSEVDSIEPPKKRLRTSLGHEDAMDLDMPERAIAFSDLDSTLVYEILKQTVIQEKSDFNRILELERVFFGKNYDNPGNRLFWLYLLKTIFPYVESDPEIKGEPRELFMKSFGYFYNSYKDMPTKLLFKALFEFENILEPTAVPRGLQLIEIGAANGSPQAFVKLAKGTFAQHIDMEKVERACRSGELHPKAEAAEIELLRICAVANGHVAFIGNLDTSSLEKALEVTMKYGGPMAVRLLLKNAKEKISTESKCKAIKDNWVNRSLNVKEMINICADELPAEIIGETIINFAEIDFHLSLDLVKKHKRKISANYIQELFLKAAAAHNTVTVKQLFKEHRNDLLSFIDQAIIEVCQNLSATAVVPNELYTSTNDVKQLLIYLLHMRPHGYYFTDAEQKAKRLTLDSALRTALYKAAEKGNVGPFFILLCYVDLSTIDLQTALVLFAGHGDLRILKHLLITYQDYSNDIIDEIFRIIARRKYILSSESRGRHAPRELMSLFDVGKRYPRVENPDVSPIFRAILNVFHDFISMETLIAAFETIPDDVRLQILNQFDVNFETKDILGLLSSLFKSSNSLPRSFSEMSRFLSEKLKHITDPRIFDGMSKILKDGLFQDSRSHRIEWLEDFFKNILSAPGCSQKLKDLVYKQLYLKSLIGLEGKELPLFPLLSKLTSSVSNEVGKKVLKALTYLAESKTGDEITRYMEALAKHLHFDYQFVFKWAISQKKMEIFAQYWVKALSNLSHEDIITVLVNAIHKDRQDIVRFILQSTKLELSSYFIHGKRLALLLESNQFAKAREVLLLEERIAPEDKGAVIIIAAENGNSEILDDAIKKGRVNRNFARVAYIEAAKRGYIHIMIKLEPYCDRFQRQTYGESLKECAFSANIDVFNHLFTERLPNGLTRFKVLSNHTKLAIPIFKKMIEQYKRNEDAPEKRERLFQMAKMLFDDYQFVKEIQVMINKARKVHDYLEVDLLLMIRGEKNKSKIEEQPLKLLQDIKAEPKETLPSSPALIFSEIHQTRPVEEVKREMERSSSREDSSDAMDLDEGLPGKSHGL